MDSEGDPLRSAFLSITESIGFDQHIHQSTHSHNHTLDLVLTHNTEIANIVVMPENPVLSDHYFITFQLSQVRRVSPVPTFYFSRKLSSRTADAFINELPGSFVHYGDFLGSSQNAYTYASVNSIDQMTTNINDVLCRTLDTIAPLKKRKVCSKKLAPWYNDHTMTVLLKKPHANSSANGFPLNYRYSSMPGKTACYPINMPSPQHVPRISLL